MNLVRKLFPLSFKMADTLSHLIVGLILYMAIAAIVGAVLCVVTFLVCITGIGLLLFPLFVLLGLAVSLYFTVGMVFLILTFCRVFRS